MYQEFKKDVARKQDPNEQLLFHGTKTGVVFKIAAKNFNRSFGEVMMYGNGMYFARDAGYSDMYAAKAKGMTKAEEFRGPRFMLRSRVVKGNCAQATLNPKPYTLHPKP
ncbi:hypothetical protein T484DRAFT_2960800 [Baffinella frigidus]|nr:hypothetical protein T484DRAFT_2960800 [Cryptophyta sp. CCMP2293]